MNKLSLDFWESKIPNFKRKIIRDAIIDRKSKYTIVAWYVKNKQDVDNFIK